MIPTNTTDGGARSAPNVVQSSAALAFQAAPPQEVLPGHVYVKARPDGSHEIIDLLDRESHLAHPRRKKGRVTLHDTASFLAYVERHQSAATLLYAAPERGTVAAVFNDHQDAQTPANEAAGWGDFTAVLTLTLTREWQHWLRQDGRLMSQVDFAEHIEQGLEEITAPPAADLLELAQRFEASKSVAFKSVRLLGDGSRQLQYEETIDAKAGQKGDVKIPREFALGIAPYEGGERFALTARLRYRLNSEQLTIGYVLVRPHKIIEAAFADVVKQIGAALDAPILRGVYGG